MSDKASRGENLAGLPTSRRDRERIGLLFFAVAAGPAAWALQELVNYAFASLACFPNDEPLQIPTISAERTILIVVNIAGLLLAAAGAAISWSLLRRTDPHIGGEEESKMPRREARIHYFAACGLLTGVGFLAATAFQTVALALVPSCSG